MSIYYELWNIGPNFNVVVPPHYETEFSNIVENLNIKIVAVVGGDSAFVSCVLRVQYQAWTCSFL